MKPAGREKGAQQFGLAPLLRMLDSQSVQRAFGFADQRSHPCVRASPQEGCPVDQPTWLSDRAGHQCETGQICGGGHNVARADTAA